jgi:hypothetical protein
MAAERRLDVQVQNDHLERLERCKPSAALAELIWNSLDADATTVSVEFTRNAVGGVEEIIVRDNGNGIGGDGQDAADVFKNLGGSWKKQRRRTSSGRVVHGQAGEGRFKAFALGQTVTWETKRREGNGLLSFSITRIRGSKMFTASEPEPSKGTKGTVVRVRGVTDSPAPDSDSVHEALRKELALYLLQYPDLTVTFDHRKIDPRKLVSRKKKLGEIVVDDRHAGRVRAKLTVLEWAVPTDRALYLCDSEGFALAEVAPGVHAPGFHFTAYLHSEHFRSLQDQNLVDSELAPGREVLIDAAKDKLRDYFRERLAEQASGAVDRWKREEIYPYQGRATGAIETAERQVFDIVALNLSGHLPDFEKSDAKQKKLTFQLVKHAVETNPNSLHQILTEVVGLPKEKQDEFAELLRQTTLPAILSAAKVVTDRLNFLAGLEHLLFDKDLKKRLLERKQLHRVLAENTWIFGEEYHLTVDDESLNTVLEKHRQMGGGSSSANADGRDLVEREDGSVGIVDLMISRVVPQPAPIQREHLVVELKRPTKKIDSEVLGQIEDYALAVARDERFRDTSTRWRFITVSNDMTDSARAKANQRHRPPGVVLDHETPALTVWAFTWGQLLEQARARLDFFKKELNYSATRDNAKAHLTKVYAKYLPVENDDQ